MSKFVVTQEDYISYPQAFIDNYHQFMMKAKGSFAKVVKQAGKPKYPAIDYMDSYYKSWIKRERKGKKVKKRHISKVNSGDLKHLHDLINRWFHLPSLECVYSYKEGISASDCAERHVGCFALYKLDISDFFPSITREMIHDAYQRYLDTIWQHCKKDLTKAKIRKGDLDDFARLIALLCTRSDTREMNKTDAVLPIGIAPASSISNHILIEVDKELKQLAEKNDLLYSRYSDNLFFSTLTDKHIDRDVQERVKGIVEAFAFKGDHPFKINASKTRYAPRWRHQRVLGIVVNAKRNIPKGREKWLRSALNHMYYDLSQLHHAVLNQTTDVNTLSNSFGQMYRRAQRLFGQLSYVYMVRPEKYMKYSAQHHAIKLLIEETKLGLQTIVEEEANAAQAGGSV